jgi:hypothetical protein
MKKQWPMLVVLVTALITLAAATQINLTTNVTGLLPVANGGTGVATANAGTVFGRPQTAGSGAPGFYTYAAVLGSIPLPNTGRSTLSEAVGDGTQNLGDEANFSGTTITNNVATSTAPPTVTVGTSAANGNVASISGNLNYVVGRNPYYQYRWTAANITTRRDWIATLTDQTSATMGASDNPAGNYAGFWFCADGAGTACQKNGSSFDATTYWCVTKDNTTQQLTDSAVTADTSAHEFEVYESAAGIYDFYIDGTKVCTNSTNPPTSGAVLRYSNTVTCIGCASGRNFDWAWTYIQTNF